MTATMNNHAQKSGRDATRRHMVEVFNRLLLEGDTPRPSVARIIAEAGVSRSTFYDHFDGVEALLSESLAGLLGQIAGCLTGEHSVGWLESLLEHINENRAMAREFLAGPRGERAEAELARAVSRRLAWDRDSRLAGILVGGTTIAALGAWVSGRVSGSPQDMAQSLSRSAAAILNARP